MNEVVEKLRVLAQSFRDEIHAEGTETEELAKVAYAYEICAERVDHLADEIEETE